MIYKIKTKLCRILKIHSWSKRSSMLCGNVAHINKLHDFQKYSYRHCWICKKEMPYSRHFFNLGVREQNAKTDN